MWDHSRHKNLFLCLPASSCNSSSWLTVRSCNNCDQYEIITIIHSLRFTEEKKNPFWYRYIIKKNLSQSRLTVCVLLPLLDQYWLFSLKEIHWLTFFCSSASLYGSIQFCLHLLICPLPAVLMARSHMLLLPAWLPTLCGDGWQPCSFSLSFSFQQPPHSSICLSIQALPSPTAALSPLPFLPPPSSSFLF